MDFIILIVIVLVCIFGLYFILASNLSDVTLFRQIGRLDLSTDFPVTDLREPDSSEYSYEMWIKPMKMTTGERVIINRENEITLVTVADKPQIKITVGKSDLLFNLPLQKYTHVTISIAKKEQKDKSIYNIIDVYSNGKLLRSFQSLTYDGSKSDKKLVVGDPNATTDKLTNGDAYATIYGLKRWAHYMSPKQVYSEFNSSRLIYQKSIDINLSLLKDDVEARRYQIF